MQEFLLENAGFIVVILFVLAIGFWILTMRRIVELKYVDVVVNKAGSKIYTADISIDGAVGSVYYEIPSWIPIIGCIVKRMPLEIIQITIKDYDTFAKANARFRVTVSVYCRINDVSMAAQRFPGFTIDDFRKGMSAIIVSAIRKTTANYAVEDIISKRKEIGDDIHNEIRPDFERWGVQLTNVAVEDIGDTSDGTVIHDISAKKEAEIRSLSRQTIAVQDKTADIVEAENRQTAETRKIEADEQISVRDQAKRMLVAEKQQIAVVKELEVERTQKETRANIDANASIREAEGIRQSNIVKAEGEKKATALRGEGEAESKRFVGVAEADVIKAKKLSEAEGLSALADAQKKQQENAKEIRLIEKDQIIGTALADALKNAHIKYYGSGTPKSFMDLFTVGGGLSAGGSIGTFLSMVKENDPALYDTVLKKIEQIGTSEKPKEEKENASSDNTGSLFDAVLYKENIEPILNLIKTTDPSLYKKIKKIVNEPEK